MKMFDVYSLFDLTPVKAEKSYIWNKNGEKYLDLYGGHAVISIGHSHPHYIQRISDQLQKIGFYSNSVHIEVQSELAQRLGEISGYPDYQLFLCNSGAEANENAIKLASFHNKKERVLAFSKAFHGRTSVAVAATDNKKIVAPVNETDKVVFAEFNRVEGLEGLFEEQEFSSVIVEGIQGVGGVQLPTQAFLLKLQELCHKHDVVLILDEIQSGYGRTGQFFAHQHFGIKPDIITTAKGMGNGFPVGGVLITPKIKPVIGMLGTTFGGNYLACAASLAVLEVIQKEKLLSNSEKMGAYLVEKLQEVQQIREIRAKGLMVGIELEIPCAAVRQQLLEKHRILTGNASQPNTLRILPSLTVGQQEINKLIKALKEELNE